MFFSDEFVDQDKTELDEFFCRNWRMFHHTFWSSPNPYLGADPLLVILFFLFIRKKIALFISTARMYTLNIFPQWNVNYYKLHKYKCIYISQHIAQHGIVKCQNHYLFLGTCTVYWALTPTTTPVCASLTFSHGL